MTKKLVKTMLIASVCITICLIMAACSKKKDVTLGEISGNTYSNDYFGFEFTFPESWDSVYSRDQVMQLTRLFNKVSSEKEIDLGEQDWLVLFMSVASGSTGGMSLIGATAYKIGAEIPSIGGKITTPEEYLKNNIGYEGEYTDVELNDIKSVKLGSKEFKYWQQSLPLGAEHDYIYVCEADGYLIEFNGATFHDGGKADIESFINSIKFK